MKSMQLCAVLAVLTSTALGCDGQQYVSPDTALLTVTHDRTGSKLASRCNYVPVLLGAQVDESVAVDSSLQASITLTREAITVTFQGSGAGIEAFHVTAQELSEATSVVDSSPPTGYTVELSSGCVPDDT